MFDTLFNLLGEKGSYIKNLFLASFRFLGDAVIRQVMINRIIFTSVAHALFLFAVISIVQHWHAGFGWLTLVGLIIIVYPWGFFYHISRRAYQVWLAYAKITGRPVTLDGAKKVAQPQRWRIRAFGLIEMSLANAANDGAAGGGITGILTSGIMLLLASVYDVAEEYLLPALLIEQSTFSQAAQKLQQLKQNIPTALAGSFGLDVFGGVISGFLFMVYGMIFLIGVGLSFGLARFLSPDWITFIHVQIPNMPQGLPVFWPPMLGGVVMIAWLHSVIKVVITSIKASYFSVFYTEINRPNEITPDYKNKVVSYLELPAKTAAPA